MKSPGWIGPQEVQRVTASVYAAAFCRAAEVPPEPDRMQKRWLEGLKNREGIERKCGKGGKSGKFGSWTTEALSA